MFSGSSPESFFVFVPWSIEINWEVKTSLDYLKYIYNSDMVAIDNLFWYWKYEKMWLLKKKAAQKYIQLSTFTRITCKNLCFGTCLINQYMFLIKVTRSYAHICMRMCTCCIHTSYTSKTSIIRNDVLVSNLCIIYRVFALRK